MDQGQTDVALRVTEVPMLEPEIVRQIRGLAAMSWGSKRIAATLGISRGAARRYLRGAKPGAQERPRARRLDADQRTVAVALLDGEAAGNAVVARQLLGERGIEVELRTLQRAVAPHRQARRAAEVATVRFETAPGHQLQIDFGERRVVVGGREMRVYFFVAVLGYSRRIYVRAFLRERHDDWREGLAGAFLHFGGVTQTVLVDNARALILGRDIESGVVHVHPAFSAFCADWGVAPRACRPYRARTKGKTESGVGYVKRNAIAGRAFESFAALEAHLAAWMIAADTRTHGTTHERPLDRFEREERQALRPLPARPLPVRQQRLSRRVPTDAFVDVETVRYSVPHRLVRRTVEVLLGDDEVVIFDGVEVVARHRRVREPFTRVVEPGHFAGLMRPHDVAVSVAPLLAVHGRTLADYAAVVAGAA
jgi:transposase